jgi:hypothetical protein
MSTINNTNTNTNTNTNNTKNNNTIFDGYFGKESVEINRMVSNIVSIFIAFYCILYASKSTTIFTCQQDAINKKYKFLQYIFTFVIFYFLAVFVDKTELELPPIQKLINCFFYFILFLMINRLDYTLSVTVLGLFCLLYFIFLNKEYYYTVDAATNSVQLNSNINNSTKLVSKINKFSTNIEKSSKNIQSHQYWITMDYPFTIRLIPVTIPQYYYLSLLNKIIVVTIIICAILGFINYIGVLKYTYKNKITLYNILFNSPNCKPLKFGLGFFEYILLAFNYNYYIKKVSKDL